MIKITGYLNTVNKNGNQIKKSKQFKNMNFRAKLYLLKMQLFYDWIDIEGVKVDDFRRL